MQARPTSLIYCFSCFETKEESGRKYVITNCQHVFCSTCFSRDSFCGICNKQCKSQEICNALPRDIKLYFDPSSPVTLVQTAVKIIHFQHNLRMNAIKKLYGYRKKCYLAKKKLVEAMAYKKKVYDSVKREKVYIEMLKKAYHTRNITPDLLKLGRSESSRMPLSVVQSGGSGGSGVMSVSTSNTSNYSPLARYSMTAKAPVQKRHVVNDRSQSFFDHGRTNKSDGSGNEENLGGTPQLDKGLLQNARNVLMVNTMRCMNESKQKSQNKRSICDDNLLYMKKVRF